MLCHAFFSAPDYRHALAVFTPEAGLSSKPLPRSYVAQQAHLHAGSELPLLYTLLTPPPELPPLPPSVDNAALEPDEPPGYVPQPEVAEPASNVAQRARYPGPTPVIFTAAS